MEAAYVKETVGEALKEALAEVALVRPVDPIEYLSSWLLQYKKNEESMKQRHKVMRQVMEQAAKQQEEQVRDKEIEQEREQIEKDKLNKQQITQSVDINDQQSTTNATTTSSADDQVGSHEQPSTGSHEQPATESHEPATESQDPATTSLDPTGTSEEQTQLPNNDEKQEVVPTSNDDS